MNKDINVAYDTVRHFVYKSKDTHDTGFVACRYKHDLLKLKWFIEDQLETCPNFGDMEKDWDQERLLQLLKAKNEV